MHGTYKLATTEAKDSFRPVLLNDRSSNDCSRCPQLAPALCFHILSDFYQLRCDHGIPAHSCYPSPLW